MRWPIVHLATTDEGVTLMGRGRQKAKQAKVARALKYYTPETDFASLERELSGRAKDADSPPEQQEESEELDDDYSDWVSEDSRNR